MKRSYWVMLPLILAGLFSISAHTETETCTTKESESVLKNFVRNDEPAQGLIKKLSELYNELLKVGNRDRRFETSPVSLIEHTKVAACLISRLDFAPPAEKVAPFSEMIEINLGLIVKNGPLQSTEQNRGMLETDITSIISDNKETIAKIIYYGKILGD